MSCPLPGLYFSPVTIEKNNRGVLHLMYLQIRACLSLIHSRYIFFFFLEYIFWTSMLNIDVIERIDRYLG